MSTCHAGGSCKITCKGGCGAIRYKEGRTWHCIRTCGDSPLRIRGKIARLKWDQIVSLDFKGVTVLDVGVFMDKICPDPIAVPARVAMRKGSATITNAPLSKAIQRLGLLAPNLKG